MKFWKYHGIGNDFVILDGINEKIQVDTDLCKKLCDRHYGVGADGVLYILSSDEADIQMRVINPDGSEAEMCGNGIRCVAKHAYDFGIVDSKEFNIQTLAGNLLTCITEESDKNTRVKIDMGAPILNGRDIPIDYDGEFIDQNFKVGKFEFKGNAVSMGNPHFVTFEKFSDKDLELLGPLLESHPFFPNKANIEFCTVLYNNLYVKVYERGAGWTLACGTGACASAVAAALNGLVSFDTPLEVHLPGGVLKITVDKNLKYVFMEGAAELVYEGNLEE